eukprot:2753894-Pleurochrysis_carterae.AAC.1
MVPSSSLRCVVLRRRRLAVDSCRLLFKLDVFVKRHWRGGAGGSGDGTAGGMIVLGVAIARPGNSVSMKRAYDDR